MTANRFYLVGQYGPDHFATLDLEPKSKKAAEASRRWQQTPGNSTRFIIAEREQARGFMRNAESPREVFKLTNSVFTDAAWSDFIARTWPLRPGDYVRVNGQEGVISATDRESHHTNHIPRGMVEVRLDSGVTQAHYSECDLIKDGSF